MQPNAAWAEVRLRGAGRGAAGGHRRGDGGEERRRAGAGARGARRRVGGALPGALAGPVAVPMNGAVYFADLAGGQKTGLFYDQRPNHAFAARLARGRSMLDVFAHVGGFALAALAAGATAALAVDGSAAGAGAGGAGGGGGRGRDGSRCGGATPSTRWRRWRRRGGASALVVCDPPAFAPNKAALEAGLRAYEKVARLGAALVEAGRVPRALLVQPRGRSGALSRGEPAAGWRGRDGRRRSCTWAGRGRTIRCIPGWRRRPTSRRCSCGLAREGAARRLRAVSDGDAGDAGRGGGGGRVRAALVGADPRGMGAGDAAAAGGGRGGGAAARSRCCAPPGRRRRWRWTRSWWRGCRCRTRTTGTCWRRRSPAGRRCS